MTMSANGEIAKTLRFCRPAVAIKPIDSKKKKEITIIKIMTVER